MSQKVRGQPKQLPRQEMSEAMPFEETGILLNAWSWCILMVETEVTLLTSLVQIWAASTCNIPFEGTVLWFSI